MNIKLPTLFKALYPWIVWLLAASFFYYKYLVQVSPGVMSSQLMSDYSLTGAGLGNLAACFFYAYLLMQIPVGMLLDKWSPRKITAGAVFLCATGTWFFANTHLLNTALLSRFIIGLAASFAGVSCFKLTSIWFPPKRFALIAGLSMTAAMLGAVGGQGPLSILVGHVGWRHSMEWVAVSGFILACLILLIIRDKKGQDPQTKNIDDIKLSMKFYLIIKNKQTWLLSLYSGLAFAPVSVFGGLWGVSFIEQSYALSSLDAANAVSLIFIGFAIGCPLAGWFSDYIERRKPLMMTGTFIALISMFFILYIPISTFFLQCMLFLFGIGGSCFFLCFSAIREIYPLFFTATVLGFMNTFDSICEAVTEPFVGKLLDLSWSGSTLHGVRLFSIHDYHLGLMILPVYLLFAQFLLFFIHETYGKQNKDGENYVHK